MRIIFSSLLILLNIPIINLKAQDYLINFKGSGASSVVSKVKVENLNQGTSITINGTDVLHLVDALSSTEPFSSYEKIQIKFSPNPMTTSSKMQFILPEAGQTIIDLYDISGRKIAQTK